jgi:hypothetical protein
VEGGQPAVWDLADTRAAIVRAIPLLTADRRGLHLSLLDPASKRRRWRRSI